MDLKSHKKTIKSEWKPQICLMNQSYNLECKYKLLVSVYVAAAFRISALSSAGEISDALLISKIPVYNPSE